MTTMRTLAAALLLQALAPCQGLIVPTQLVQPIPTGPAVTSGLLSVRIEVRDGAATTTLRQTIKNSSLQQQEALWVLPLPAGATADRFAMTVAGQKMDGEVLTADAARSVYEEIVRKRRDPGLLEYLGQGCIRARVFPIPPQGEVQVEVRFAQLLASTDGVTAVNFASRSAWLDGTGPEKLAVVVDVQSTGAIKTAWSPQPEFAIARDGDHKLLASAEYARGNLPTRDLQLHFGLADQDFGAHVLTYRRQGQPGYFVAWIAPKRDWPEQPAVHRSLNLVLDTSGSMAGEKIVQARAAVRAFLQSLSPGDWFNIVPFSTDARPFFPMPVRADKENLANALAQIDQLEARGGTNIGDALQFALAHGLPSSPVDGQLVPITIFLTDGLPTVGTTDVDALLATARTGNTGKTRLFAFGVGHDVNTRLLDTLAAESRGDRDYVLPGENIEAKTSSLYRKLSGPVMTDLQLAIDGIGAKDLEPAQLPDLFVQGQLAVFGRYDGDGHRAIRLRGTVGGKAMEYVFEATFPATATGNDWLPSLWAQRRVTTLLDVIRSKGNVPELVAEVTRLGKEFGLVTPFTSHLVVEEGMKLARVLRIQTGFADMDAATTARLRGEWSRAGVAAPTAGAPLQDLEEKAKEQTAAAGGRFADRKETGAAAVEESLVLLTMRTDMPAADDGVVGLMHRRVGERTFHLLGGVWIDSAVTEALRATARRIPVFGDEYFALLRQHQELGATFAFSTRLVVVVDGAAIELVE